MPRGVYPRKKKKKDLFAKRVVGGDKAIPDSSIPKGVIVGKEQEREYKVDQLISDLELVRKVIKAGLLPDSIMDDIASECRKAIRQVVSRKLMS